MRKLLTTLLLSCLLPAFASAGELGWPSFAGRFRLPVADSTWVTLTTDTITAAKIITDTMLVRKHFYEQHVALFDSSLEVGRDGDTLRVDASKNANVLEYEDENVVVAALDSAGNWSAKSLTATPDEGAELITNFAGWTPTTNWTYASAKWSHATGNATALVSNWQPTVGVNYKVTYTLAQSVEGTGVTLSFGGASFMLSSAAGTYTYYFTATETTAMTFTPGAGGTWVGDITSVSAKALTNGDASFVDGTFSGQMLGSVGSATYPTYAFRNKTNTGFYYDCSGIMYFALNGTNSFYVTSSGLNIVSGGRLGLRGGSAFIYSDANNQFDFRNSTNPNILNFYNAYTSATSYERGFARATATAIEFGSEKGSAGGTARPVNFYTDGVARASISATGITTFADTLRAPRVTASGGLRVGPQASESITAIDTIKTPSGGAVRWVKLTVAGVDFLAFPAADSSSFRNP